MKLDKDTLIKEHFWFLLLLASVLVVLSLILVWSTAPGAIAAQQKSLDDQKKKLEGIVKSQPKNEKWVKSYEKRYELAGEQEKKIWERAWLDQAGLFTWPTTLPKEALDTLNSLKFYDPIDSNIRTAYGAERQYRPQVNQLYEIVPPTQMNAGLRYVPEWISQPPTAEDMWLAQEDLSVQRGLLQIIKETNDRLAEMKEQKSTNENQKSFANDRWELDLSLATVNGKPGMKYKLQNVGNRKQVLPVSFTVAFSTPPQTDTIEFHGEPLGPGKSMTGERALPIQLGNPRGLKSVRQLFDWRTVPVKRIDRVEMGAVANSSRTAISNPTMQMPLASKAREAEAAAAPADAAASGGAMAMGGTSKPDTSMTENKLLRNRYLDCSKEVRRMPIGLAVVVDQAHMQDFLAAVANSPLRIQTTQWHWVRFHGDIKPPDGPIDPSVSAPPMAPPGGKSSGGLPQPVPGMKSGAGGELGETSPGKGVGMPQRPGPLMQPPGSGFAPSTAAAAADEQEWDLVELAVYGLASLYEKYPPPDATKTADAAAPANAKTPADGPAVTPKP